MKCIHSATISICQSVQLKDAFKVSLSLCSIIVEEHLSTHEVQIRIVIHHLYTNVIIFKSPLGISLHFKAPSSFIIGVSFIWRLLNCGRKIRYGGIDIPGQTIIISPATEIVPRCILLHYFGNVSYGHFMEAKFAVAITPVDIDLVIMTELVLKFIISLNCLGIFVGLLIILAK